MRGGGEERGDRWWWGRGSEIGMIGGAHWLEGRGEEGDQQEGTREGGGGQGGKVKAGQGGGGAVERERSAWAGRGREGVALEGAHGEEWEKTY